MLRRLIDSPATYFVAAGILLVVAIATQVQIGIPSRPKGSVDDIAALKSRGDLNFVFILIDTLRADRMGIYGYERNTTPVIDDLARHGIIFDNVLAQSSWTKTSMASLWTGSYPARNGILRYNHVLPPEVTMPAELFDAAGYRTAGIWRNGWVAPNFGFNQGFEIYHQPKPGAETHVQRRSPSPRPINGTDEDLALSTMDFLDNFAQKRFFLYLHMMDLHQYVFDEQAEDFGPMYTDAYDKSLSWADRVVGVLVKAIDDAGILQKTVIVIASDHGEAFMEHGWEGHARNLYLEVIHVPLIIIPPFILEEGIRVDAQIANVDVWPTLLDLVGLPSMGDTDGRSMLPLILEAGGSASPGSVEGLRRPIFAHMDSKWGSTKKESKQLVSMIDEDFRVIVHRYEPRLNEFYSLRNDRAEKRNLYQDSPAKLAAMLEEIDNYLGNTTAPWGAEPGTIELDAMRLNQLRALGYHIGN